MTCVLEGRPEMCGEPQVEGMELVAGPIHIYMFLFLFFSFFFFFFL